MLEDLREEEEDISYEVNAAIDVVDYVLECLAYAQQAMNDSGSTGAEADKHGNSRNDFDILKKFSLVSFRISDPHQQTSFGTKSNLC